MSEETTNVQPEGKGMAVTGFILALVGLVFAWPVAGIAAASVLLGGSAWLIYVWIVVCLLGVVLSGMGMSKLGKTGGKKGLGIAGLVIGLVALIWSVVLLMGVNAAASLNNDVMDRFDDALDQLEQMEDIEFE